MILVIIGFIGARLLFVATHHQREDASGEILRRHGDGIERDIAMRGIGIRNRLRDAVISAVATVLPTKRWVASPN